MSLVSLTGARRNYHRERGGSTKRPPIKKSITKATPPPIRRKSIKKPHIEKKLKRPPTGKTLQKGPTSARPEVRGTAGVDG